MKFCGVAVAALLLFGSFKNEGLAQSRIQKALNQEPDWKWSKLTLLDGRTLEGMAWYNTKSGALMFTDNRFTITYSANKNEDGILEPYSQRTESDRNELIKNYSGEHYNAFMKFVKEKNSH